MSAVFSLPDLEDWVPTPIKPGQRPAHFGPRVWRSWHALIQRMPESALTPETIIMMTATLMWNLTCSKCRNGLFDFVERYSPVLHLLQWGKDGELLRSSPSVLRIRFYTWVNEAHNNVNLKNGKHAYTDVDSWSLYASDTSDAWLRNDYVSWLYLLLEHCPESLDAAYVQRVEEARSKVDSKYSVAEAVEYSAKRVYNSWLCCQQYMDVWVGALPDSPFKTALGAEFCSEASGVLRKCWSKSSQYMMRRLYEIETQCFGKPQMEWEQRMEEVQSAIPLRV